MYSEQGDTRFQGVSVGKACGQGESVAMLHHTGMAAIETFGRCSNTYKVRTTGGMGADERRQLGVCIGGQGH